MNLETNSMNRDEISDQVGTLIGKIEEQERLYHELSEVSRSQIAELEREDGGDIEQFVAQKRAILERLERIDAITHAMYTECEPRLDMLTDTEKLKLQVTRLRAAEALKEAVATERLGSERAKAHLERISNDLAEINRVRRVAEKYRPVIRGEHDSKFIDKLQ